jgi:surface antigen
MTTSTRILSGLAAALLLATGAGVAEAANLGFLNDTPASYMTQDDYGSLTKAVRTAVDQTPDGQSTTWSNAGSRNAVQIEATITPTKTDKDGDKTCRTMQVVVTAKQQTMTLLPQFCRQGTGAWVFQKKH